MKRFFAFALLLSTLTIMSGILSACGSRAPEEAALIATAVPAFTPAPPRATRRAVATRAVATAASAPTVAVVADTSAEVTTEANRESANETTDVVDGESTDALLPTSTAAAVVPNEPESDDDETSEAVAASEIGDEAEDTEVEEATAEADDGAAVKNADTVAPAEQVEDTDGVKMIPDTLATLVAAGDPVNGELLTITNTCIACHNVDPAVQMVGPTWHNVAEKRAASRVEGQSALDYLYNSIIYPNDYVVDEYLPNLMLQTFGDTISDEDLADILAYLVSLRDMP